MEAKERRDAVRGDELSAGLFNKPKGGKLAQCTLSAARLILYNELIKCM